MWNHCQEGLLHAYQTNQTGNHCMLLNDVFERSLCECAGTSQILVMVLVLKKISVIDLRKKHFQNWYYNDADFQLRPPTSRLSFTRIQCKSTSSGVSCVAPRPAAALHPAALLGGDGNLGCPVGQKQHACKERTEHQDTDKNFFCIF